MTRSRAAKAEHVGMGMYAARVTRSQRLSPGLVRITLSGPGLAGFRDDGPDQRFKLLLPQPGQQRPAELPADGWYEHWLAMPADTRPVMRTYTIRQARPSCCEVDVDVVLHEPAGPASTWARTAQAGDHVALYGAWAEYEAPADARWQLIVGDHAALPAIAAIIERLPPTASARVLIEVPTAADRLELVAGPGVEVSWVADGRLLEAVSGLAPLPGPGYAWVAGEQQTAAAIRRLLVGEHGLATDRVMFMGYWRRGGAIDG